MTVLSGLNMQCTQMNVRYVYPASSGIKMKHRTSALHISWQKYGISCVWDESVAINQIVRDGKHLINIRKRNRFHNFCFLCVVCRYGILSLDPYANKPFSMTFFLGSSAAFGLQFVRRFFLCFYNPMKSIRTKEQRKKMAIASCARCVLLIILFFNCWTKKPRILCRFTCTHVSPTRIFFGHFFLIYQSNFIFHIFFCVLVLYKYVYICVYLRFFS